MNTDFRKKRLLLFHIFRVSPFLPKNSHSCNSSRVLRDSFHSCSLFLDFSQYRFREFRCGRTAALISCESLHTSLFTLLIASAMIVSAPPACRRCIRCSLCRPRRLSFPAFCDRRQRFFASLRMTLGEFRPLWFLVGEKRAGGIIVEVR